MPPRKSSTGSKNIYRFVRWEVPKHRGADGQRHVRSKIMALPTSGTPVDTFERCTARAAKFSMVTPEDVVILEFVKVPSNVE